MLHSFYRFQVRHAPASRTKTKAVNQMELYRRPFPHLTKEDGGLPGQSFPGPLELPDDFWHGHLAELIDQRQKAAQKEGLVGFGGSQLQWRGGPPRGRHRTHPLWIVGWWCRASAMRHETLRGNQARDDTSERHTRAWASKVEPKHGAILGCKEPPLKPVSWRLERIHTSL